MELEIGLSDSGLVVPRTADYLTEIRGKYAEETGLAVDWESDLILGVLTAIMAQLLDQQAEAIQAVYDSFNEGSATGVQLANIAALAGVSIKSPTAAQATVTITGTAGTIITTDKLVEGGGGDGRARWALTVDVTIPTAGTIDTIVQAVVPGYTVALAGTIDTIVTPVPGWTTVANAANAAPGADAETDSELRIRRRQSIQLAAGLNISAILAKLLALDFVEDAGFVDNPDNEPNIVEGILLDSSSYLAVVAPSTLTTAQQTQILQLLYDSAPVGIKPDGTAVVGQVTGSDGFNKTVSFDYSIDVPGNVVVVLKMEQGFSLGDAGPALQALIDAFVADLTIGDPLRQITVIAMADQVPGIIEVETMSLAGVVDTDLEITAVQRITAGTFLAQPTGTVL